MKTNANFTYHRDLERDGLLVYQNAETIKTYIENAHTQPKWTDMGVFFAYDCEQFKRHYAELVANGFIKDGDEVKRLHEHSGCFGTLEGFERMTEYLESRNERITNECDPVEVFVFEYNNHECMYSGIEAPKAIVARYWGNEVAERVAKSFRY